MNDFQEQAKNWLRNVVKQNPDKIKSGVDKAGDLIDKQTGGKYAEKVDAVQQKVGNLVDSQSSEEAAAPPADAAGDGAPEAADQAGSSGAGNVASPGGGDPGVVGGEVPDPASNPESSVGSQTGRPGTTSGGS